MADTFRTTVGRIKVRDGLQNFEARLGIGTDNQLSSSRYGMVPLTRNRAELDNMYRGSWVVRQAVGVVADDMTRAGIEIQGLENGEDVDKLQNAMKRLGLWQEVASGSRWGRLYGGALAVIVIDGQKMSEPLRPETVGKGQFKGLAIIDRWSLQPSTQLVNEFGPDFGKPVYYDVINNANQRDVLGRIHHTRAIRFEGDDLPYFQRQYENGWSMSIVEPFHDRLVAFDSTTMGAAQMVFRAYLRILKMKNLRKSIADGGKAFDAAISQVETMRRYQSLEGISLIDSEDEFSAVTYQFGGMADIIMQMAQQVSGATGIPLVKLFGMSPAGFSTGDTDLRNYYDSIGLRQERTLRRPLEVVMSVLIRSELGRDPEPDFGFTFAPLWGMSAQEKATVTSSVTTSVISAFSSGVIRRGVALRELQAIGRVTGTFGSISQEDLDEADEEDKAPDLPALPGGEAGSGDEPGEPQTEEQVEAVSEPDDGAASQRARDSAEPWETRPFPLKRVV
jgi:hypothetical protein